MRRLLQIILLKPILWFSNKIASRPQREKIFAALSILLHEIEKHPGKKGPVISIKREDQFIIFSDQHRGAKNGADDFMNAEPNYLAALDYYYKNDFHFISLGDNEELWENSLVSVKKYNAITFEAEKLFVQQKRFYKIFGNHDLYWANDPLAAWQLKKIYGEKVKVYEGLILKLTIDHPIAIGSALTIFLTHGHQGDASSDGNWFSKFFVSRIWAPLQVYLKINPNTPAYNTELKTEHNRIMYEWSSQQKNLLLITGHTHQPVFKSLTYPEKLFKELLQAKSQNDSLKVQQLEAALSFGKKENNKLSEELLSMKPSYFNSGCCCFSDGDITGIEITHENISLIKWSKQKEREILEQSTFRNLHTQFK